MIEDFFYFQMSYSFLASLLILLGYLIPAYTLSGFHTTEAGLFNLAAQIGNEIFSQKLLHFYISAGRHFNKVSWDGKLGWSSSCFLGTGVAVSSWIGI